jgi:CheY-like chemotaxis protein
LLVDDDRSFLVGLRSHLMQHGFRVLLAGDGEKALSLVEKLGAELTHAIVDIALPVVGGYEVISTIHRGPHDIRVIAVTEAANEYYLEIAKAMGAHDALKKPAMGNSEAERAWYEQVIRLF